jgi:hypothetical protein
MFFAQHTFSIFVSLAVTWGPNLDPCCKSVFLAGAIKIYVKVVYVFFTQQTFPIFIQLAVTWCHNLDPCGNSVILNGAIKNYIKVVYGFYPADIFHFHLFGCHLVS